MVVGLQVGQGLIYGDVETGGYKGVLETRTLRGVVMDVVGCHHRNAGISCYSRQLPVAVRVSLQEVLLQLHVHGAGTEPVQVLLEQPGSLSNTVFHGEAGEGTVAASGQKDDPLRVVGQVRGVQSGIPTVDVVGQGEESGDVGVSCPSLGKQRQARAVGEGQFPAGDGPDAQVVGQPGELQGAAQVGVRKGEGRDSRGPWLWPVARGRETLPARRNKNSWRGALRIPPSSGRLPVPTVVPPVTEQGHTPAVAGVHPVVGAGDGFGEPPQIKGPPVIDAGHRPPAPTHAHRPRLSVPFRPHLNGLRRLEGLDGISSRRVHGHLQGPHLRGRMPGGHLGYPVQGVASSHEGPQLPIHLHQPLEPVIPCVHQKSQLRA